MHSIPVWQTLSFSVLKSSSYFLQDFKFSAKNSADNLNGVSFYVISFFFCCFQNSLTFDNLMCLRVYLF